MDDSSSFSSTEHALNLPRYAESPWRHCKILHFVSFLVHTYFDPKNPLALLCSKECQTRRKLERSQVSRDATLLNHARLISTSPRLLSTSHLGILSLQAPVNTIEPATFHKGVVMRIDGMGEPKRRRGCLGRSTISFRKISKGFFCSWAVDAQRTSMYSTPFLMIYSVRWGWNSVLIYWLSRVSISSDFHNAIAQFWKPEFDSSLTATRLSGEVTSSWVANPAWHTVLELLTHRLVIDTVGGIIKMNWLLHKEIYSNKHSSSIL